MSLILWDMRTEKLDCYQTHKSGRKINRLFSRHKKSFAGTGYNFIFFWRQTMVSGEGHKVVHRRDKDNQTTWQIVLITKEALYSSLERYKLEVDQGTLSSLLWHSMKHRERTIWRVRQPPELGSTESSWGENNEGGGLEKLFGCYLTNTLAKGGEFARAVLRPPARQEARLPPPWSLC